MSLCGGGYGASLHNEGNKRSKDILEQYDYGLGK